MPAKRTTTTNIPHAKVADTLVDIDKHEKSGLLILPFRKGKPETNVRWVEREDPAIPSESRT